MNEKTVFGKLSPADSFSLLNSIFGITSIFFIYMNKYWMAFLFLLLAVLADGLDGMVARKYGGNIGIIDEFADMLSFVASPSIFILAKYGAVSIPFLYAYVIASIIHLLNYHYSSKNFFLGLPTPAAALIVASMSIMAFPLWICLIVLAVTSSIVALPIKYVRIEGIPRIASALIIILVAIFGTKLLPVFFSLLILYVFFGSILAYMEK